MIFHIFHISVWVEFIWFVEYIPIFLARKAWNGGSAKERNIEFGKKDTKNLLHRHESNKDNIFWQAFLEYILIWKQEIKTTLSAIDLFCDVKLLEMLLRYFKKIIVSQTKTLKSLLMGEQVKLKESCCWKMFKMEKYGFLWVLWDLNCGLLGQMHILCAPPRILKCLINLTRPFSLCTYIGKHQRKFKTLGICTVSLY